MAEHPLAIYLNDHLSGSEVALQLLGYIERMHSGDAVGRFATKLRAEITADRRELESLMARLEIGVSAPRQASAWISATFTELKLWVDDARGGALRQLELWEALSLGIEGKRLLWRALATAAETEPALAGVNYVVLEHRAEEQRRSVETLRAEAARAALGRPSEAARAKIGSGT